MLRLWLSEEGFAQQIDDRGMRTAIMEATEGLPRG